MSKLSCLIIYTYIITEFYGNTLNAIAQGHITTIIFLSEQVIGLN